MLIPLWTEYVVSLFRALAEVLGGKMIASFWTKLVAGQSYAKAWPQNKALAVIFPEQRIIKMTNFALATAPPLAALNVVVQVNYFGTSFLPQALASSLFYLMLPVQGLFWLGKRAQTELPPRLLSWYKEIEEKMRSQGHSPGSVVSQPKYSELANLLDQVFKKMDKAFTRELF